MDRYVDKFDYLISCGYDKDMIYKYFYVEEDVISKIVGEIFDNVTLGKLVSDSPKCLIVGGQPGCGKSCYCSEFMDKNGNYVYVNLDSYRVFHPYYNEIRDMVIGKWGDNDGDSEESPNNDFVNITHYFAVRVNDLLLDRLCLSGYNILLEWNLRYPEGPIDFARNLCVLGYTIEILVVVTPRDVSYEACNLRYDIIKNFDRLVRRVPKYFHDLCVDNLPYSLGKILKVGFLDEGVISDIKCILRDGTVIWKSGMGDISSVLDRYLNSKCEFVGNDASYVRKMYRLENSK